MALLAVLEFDLRSLALLQTALGVDHQLVTCACWTQLQEVVRNQAVEGCILDIYGASEPVTLRELQQLRRRQPPVAIVVHADFRGREMDLFELGRLDVDGVILAEQEEDHRAIRDTVRQAMGTVVALRVRQALLGRIPVAGLDCLAWAVEHATDAPTVDHLAGAFGLTRRTLARELRERDLPAPSEFLLWGRLFRAVHVLDAPGRTVEAAAFAVGYSSGAALGRAFRRETGYPPTETVRRGGAAVVLQAFLKACGSGAVGRRSDRSRGPGS